MYKSVALIVAVVCAFALVVKAAPSTEDAAVRQAMRRSFEEGLERFGGAVKERNDNVVPVPDSRATKVFSLYSKGLTALGGGKPAMTDQYRSHGFVPLAPTVFPVDHGRIRGKEINAAEAAKRFVPQRPLQYTEDRMFR